MKYKDYKILEEHREDDVHIDWASVRFTEGEYQKVKRKDWRSGIIYDSDKYVRTKELKKVDLSDLGNVKVKYNASGEELIKYTDEDFGIISTHEELQQFLNKQLDKLKGREAIAEQKWIG